jgi:hypothetical protein
MAEETEQQAPKKQLSLAEQIKEGAKAHTIRRP